MPTLLHVGEDTGSGGHQHSLTLSASAISSILWVLRARICSFSVLFRLPRISAYLNFLGPNFSSEALQTHDSSLHLEILLSCLFCLILIIKILVIVSRITNYSGLVEEFKQGITWPGNSSRREASLVAFL